MSEHEDEWQLEQDKADSHTANAALRDELEQLRADYRSEQRMSEDLEQQRDALKMHYDATAYELGLSGLEGHSHASYIQQLKQERDGYIKRIEEEEPIFHSLTQQLAAMTQELDEASKPDGYLHGWPRNDGTVLIGVGVHCAGCGKSFGITTVAFSDDYVAPTEKPSWPWPETDCPMCHAEEHWRKKLAVDPLAERLKAKLKEKAI